ncbi:unnamed protein product [Camellia sinensis]
MMNKEYKQASKTKRRGSAGGLPFPVGLLYRYLSQLSDQTTVLGAWISQAQAAKVAEILSQYGIEPPEYGPVENAFRKKPQEWVDFMMKYIQEARDLLTRFFNSGSVEKVCRAVFLRRLGC